MESSLKKALTEKEKNFCYHYASTGNPREAAAFAGYSVEAEKKGVKLLSKDNVKEEIEKMLDEKKKNFIYKAYIGYDRLAFGSVADAIKLLYVESLDEVSLENMDLFNIAEIKRPKEGAIEIKFFDRMRALEKLEQMGDDKKTDIRPFYQAMEQGIKAIEENRKSYLED